MRKMKEIEVQLSSNAFLKHESLNQWQRDDLIIRFFDNQMEVYEELNVKGIPKYYLSEIDAEILSDILDSYKMGL